MKDKVTKLFKYLNIISIGMVLIALLAVYFLISGAKSVRLNNQLEEQVQKIELENQVIDLEIFNTKQVNQSLDNPYYTDLQARLVLGKALPGETLYVLPKESAVLRYKTEWKPKD
jgi:cell division protein FtsB